MSFILNRFKLNFYFQQQRKKICYSKKKDYVRMYFILFKKTRTIHPPIEHGSLVRLPIKWL